MSEGFYSGWEPVAAILVSPTLPIGGRGVSVKKKIKSLIMVYIYILID